MKISLGGNDLSDKETRRNRPAFLMTLALFGAAIVVVATQLPAAGPLVSPIPDSEIRNLESRLLAASVPCVPGEPVPCIATTVTIDYDPTAPAGFEGAVQSTAPCIAGRTVDLYHTLSGAPPIGVTPVGTTTSDADGLWHINVATPQVGTYTVVVTGQLAGTYAAPVHCDEGRATKTYTAVGSNVVAYITNDEPFKVNLGGGEDVCREDRTVSIYQGGTAGQRNGTLVGGPTTFDFLTTIPVSPLVPNTTYHAEMDPASNGTVYCQAATASINVGAALTTTITGLSYNSSNSKFTGTLGPSGDCRISTRVVRLQVDNGGTWQDVAGATSTINSSTGAFTITHAATAGSQYRVYVRPYLRNVTPYNHCTNATSSAVTA